MLFSSPPFFIPSFSPSLITTINQFIIHNTPYNNNVGTVCIGTFGLRGSTTEDNSAAAVEAASRIISQLQTIGLNASIGIASGKAFCGLVGSSVRHEYAVMGPSVNLSARLMCAAECGSILCDEKTMESDRRHRYVAKSDIIAKGFDSPVRTYRPTTTTILNTKILKSKSKSSSSPTSNLKNSDSNSITNSNTNLNSNSNQNSTQQTGEKTNTITGTTIGTTLSSDGKTTTTKEGKEGKVKRKTSSPTLTPLLIPFSNLNSPSGNSPVSTDDSEESSDASTDDISFSGLESGLFGRVHVLSKIFSFILPDESSSMSRANSRDDFTKYLMAEMHKNFTKSPKVQNNEREENNFAKIFSAKKMKLIVVSGPYGIGKSSVLKAILQKVLITSSPVLKFKYYTQANSYNKSTTFFVWKKILIHLLTVLHFPSTKNINDDDTTSSTSSRSAFNFSFLSTVPENYVLPHTENSPLKTTETASKTNPTTPIFKRATIMIGNKLMKSSKKQATIAANIRQLVSQLEPSMRELEPLLFNGLLSR